MCYQKSLIFAQKSTIFDQKSPVFDQMCFIELQQSESAPLSIQSALMCYQKNAIIVQTSTCSIQRALYSSKCALTQIERAQLSIQSALMCHQKSPTFDPKGPGLVIRMYIQSNPTEVYSLFKEAYSNDEARAL